MNEHDGKRNTEISKKKIYLYLGKTKEKSFFIVDLDFTTPPKENISARISTENSTKGPNFPFKPEAFQHEPFEVCIKLLWTLSC